MSTTRCNVSPPQHCCILFLATYNFWRCTKKVFPPKYFETNKLSKSCVVLSHLCMAFIEFEVFNFSGTNNGKERVFLNFSPPGRGFEMFCSPTLFLVYSTHLGGLLMVFQPCSKIMNSKERHTQTYSKRTSRATLSKLSSLFKEVVSLIKLYSPHQMRSGVLQWSHRNEANFCCPDFHKCCTLHYPLQKHISVTLPSTQKARKRHL